MNVRKLLVDDNFSAQEIQSSFSEVDDRWVRVTFGGAAAANNHSKQLI